MLRPTRYPRLAQPPIVEALIEFSAQFDEAVPAEALEVAPEDVLGPGTVSTPIQRFRADVFFGAPGHAGASAGSELHGHRYQSADGTRVAQFRTDGMTFSVLHAYTSWEDLQRAALNAFAVYQRCVGAPVPVRVATRFINQFSLPTDTPLDAYLVARPALPSGLPGGTGILSFHAQTQFDLGDGVAATLVLGTSDPGPAAPTGQIVLDVSASDHAAIAFDAGLADETPDVRNALSRIREAKNALFFGALTPLALSTFSEVP